MTNIFVGNLSYQTTEDDLQQQFSVFGTVEWVSIIRDRESGQSRGFGFVEMPNAEEAERAIQNMNGKQISHRQIPLAMPGQNGGGSHGWFSSVNVVWYSGVASTLRAGAMPAHR